MIELDVCQAKKLTLLLQQLDNIKLKKVLETVVLRMKNKIISAEKIKPVFIFNKNIKSRFYFETTYLWDSGIVLLQSSKDPHLL